MGKVAVLQEGVKQFQFERMCNYLICDDCLNVLRSLPDESIDLIYIDPPFCTQSRRNTTKDSHRYEDYWSEGLKGYLEFLTPRLEEMRRVLKMSGSIFIHLDYRTVHYVRVELDRIFGGRNFMNEIIWSYRTGGVGRRWFSRKHQNILVYAKKLGQHKFRVIREGKFRTDGLNYDEKGKPYKTTRKGRLYFNPAGPVLTDVWDIPFLSTVGKERTGYPDQKPIELLLRIIRAVTDENDMVADFFVGAGTTLHAAEILNRRWLGVDINPLAVKLSGRRLNVL